ncbi:MAG: restriction endonuclease subunit S, partial [Candidatus Dadabacteria bacterium]|nr:restriction endonuclease subunit S [Candidatus Dadabacteria bacterium]
SFLCEMKNDTTIRLDVPFNNPARETLIANLKKHPYEELGNLIDIKREKSVSLTDFYKLVDLEQVDEKTGRIVSLQEVSILGSKKILLETNDLLIAKLQPDKGKIAIVSCQYDGAVGSSEFIPVILKSTNVSLKYLWAVLRSDYVLRQWKYVLTGSSRMRIGLTELKRTIIPIPDREVQDEITSSIDKIIAESDKALEESDSLLNKARQHFISSLL